MKINRLEISTGNLKAQLKFYRNLLGLAIKGEDENSFEVAIGFSILKFTSSTSFTPYHIAIHIPDKQEEKALIWLKSRVDILKNEDEEIVDFSAWNARSVYFYDADHNIMEFISRRNFFKNGTDEFSEKSMLGIAETGLPTSDIREKFDLLNKHFNLEKFDGDFNVFCAIGDDLGLLITIDKNKKDWFPTNDKAFSSNFKIEFTHQNLEYSFIFQEDSLEIPN
ncbi:MAG TPA: VOC family protein [Gillisia sp.]|nr:VOC family protein [Gillisia sp.]